MKHMEYIDIFNGDADGICALHQLRLASPVENAQLITGVKRDISLLAQVVEQKNCQVTALDISFDKNREAAQRLLANGNTIFYVDHHHSGELPQDDGFTSIIDPSPRVCTSLLVNAYLDEKYPLWALVGAYGDNLDAIAKEKADKIGLDEKQRNALQQLGRLLNYNAYGVRLEDLHVHPRDLYKEVSTYTDPLDCYASSALIAQLEEGYKQDMAEVDSLSPVMDETSCQAFVLPSESWSRRVSGVFANTLARQAPQRAHVVAQHNPDGSFLISVRAPLERPEGADVLCRRFPTGGGRAAGAGVTALPAELWQDFLDAFHDQFDSAQPFS